MPSTAGPLTITITDENGIAVPGARVALTAEGRPTLRLEANYLGKVQLRSLAAGDYQVQVQRENYYAVTIPDLKVPQSAEAQVTLHHVAEYREKVEVTDSPQAVELAQTASQEQLTNREIFSLPYPVTRDFRQVLPFIPQVLLDNNQQIHVAGAADYQLYEQLDGFDVTRPAAGLFDLRTSPDALRLINVQTTRYSPAYGKGSGGVLQLESGMGDNNFRFTATNFTPGLKLQNGLEFENVTPRFVFSGPIKKNKAWWFEGIDGEYDTNYINDIKKGPNQDPLWRIDSLSKVQVNLTPGNILTGSFLINHEKDERVGLSVFTPIQGTNDQHHDEYLGSLRDTNYFKNGVLLDTGVAVSEFRSDTLPRGSGASIQTAFGSAGSFFERSTLRGRRVQGTANVTLPRKHWHGTHEFKIGLDEDAVRFDGSSFRNPLLLLQPNGTLASRATFTNPPAFATDNVQSTLYAQDRWSPSDRMIVEYGLRGDWDQVIREFVPSPRVAGSYLLDRDSMTKLSLGAGLVYDATNLNFISQPQQGTRTDQNFAADGVTPVGLPVVTMFSVDRRELHQPRYVNWSAAVERMLPGATYLKLEFLEKRGRHGLDFVNQSPTPAIGGLYRLTSGRNDRYDSISVTAHRKFAETHELFGSYVHSVAHSSAVLDFNLDNPLFAQQAGGPLPWDSPNRVLSWGWVPATRWFDFAYSLDWRTGFPFNVMNQTQQLVGAPDRLRFPDFFTLNAHLEHRFVFKGHQWAVRLGFNNVTGRKNPALVNSDIDSPQFLTFGATQKRALTARIRLVGKKSQ
ncbi:MAG TPA: carboxypeptidase regulatory-like domain-containing protein [Terriglobales bacterium]|nr:carboxypeptidase regulatory-like domain-containing protein [Terriglobales bacterium]